MTDVKYKVNFSNGTSITLSEESVIFPITLSEDKEGVFSSTPPSIKLGEESHHHHGLIPVLTRIFLMDAFFTVDTEDYYDTTVYKTSAVVSISTIKDVQLKTFSF